MAPRHTAAPAGVGAHRAVAFSAVGGSGLIVVVIVAAWALFLVPQWMHRRASAAAHLADRIPDQGSPDARTDASEDAEPAAAESSRSRPRGGFGRRHLSRRPRSSTGVKRQFRSWQLPSLPSLRRPSTTAQTVPASAAARRRRILAVLAAATLLTAVVAALAGLVGIPFPGWLVAVPGGLMVGYLVLLAIVRPGARRQPVRSLHQDEPEVAATESDGGSSLPVVAVPVASLPVAVSAGDSRDDVEVRASAAEAVDASWTPVPLPAPTYVTAPKARRSVRIIDLSNPGSWTATPGAADAAAADLPEAHGEPSEDDDYLIEHRRAVGD